MTPVSTPPMTPHLTPEKFPKSMNFPLFWSILRVLQANEANSDWGITKLYLSHVLAAYFITFLSTFFSLRNFSSKLLKYLAVCANPRRVSAKFGGFPPVSIPRLRCRHRLTPAKNRCRGRHRWHRHRCQPIPNSPFVPIALELCDSRKMRIALSGLAFQMPIFPPRKPFVADEQTRQTRQYLQL